MSTLRISAQPVRFNDGGCSFLIDGKRLPDEWQRTAEVKRLADVTAAIEAMKRDLASADPATGWDHDSTLDENRPNGFKLFARIVQGRAPSGFNAFYESREGRRAMEIRGQS